MFNTIVSPRLVMTVCAVLLGIGTSRAQSDDATVTARIVSSEIVQAPSSATISNYVATLGPTGTWSDVNYADTSQTVWDPATHTARLLDMARAYRLTTHAWYNAPALSNAVHLALNAFTKIDPQSSNWWYNEIDTPRKIGRTILILGTEAGTAEVAQAMTILNRADTTGMTGQNMLWEAGNILVKGLIINSNAVASNAAKNITALFVTTTGEGVQNDWSFQQHGPQLYTGGYGAGFGDDGAMWLETIRETAWAATTQQVDVLARYMADGVRWPIWGKYWDFSVTGRGISRGPNGATGMADAFLRMTNLVPAQAATFRAFGNALNSSTGAFGGVLSGQIHYWESDATYHRRTNWFCSIRGCSPRVQGTECGNGEGLKDYYLGDGLMSFQRDGLEYRNIQPVWNWRQLPGVTCSQATGALPVLDWNGYLGSNSFVGGVCDGTNGAMVMTLARDGLSLKKAWFLFDDTVLCLGARVFFTNDANAIATTINQCLWRTNAVLATTTSTQTLAAGTFALTNSLWLFQGGIGYLPISAGSGGTFRLSLQAQTGTWASINTALATDPVTSLVLTAWADHGTKPTNGAYAYAVFPNATTSTMPALAASPPFAILGNTTNAQAAFFTAPSVLQAIFHAAGAVTSPAGTRISVGARCALMAQLRSNAVTLAVSLPDHATSTLTVRVNRALSGPGATWDASNHETRIAVPMPQGTRAGSTTSLVFSVVAEALPVVDSNLGADTWMTSASLNGNLTAGEPADVRIVWDWTDRGSNVVAWTNAIILPGQMNGLINGVVTGLPPGSSLVYRCFASNNLGSAWSAPRPFRTLPLLTASNIAGLALWLDASDLRGNGTSPTNNAAVTNWVDKSGNLRDARGAAAAVGWPRFRTTNFAGRSSVTFSGTNYLSCGNVPLYDNDTGMTLLVVARMSNETDKAIVSKSSWSLQQREWVLHSSDFQVQEVTNAMNAANRINFAVETNAQCLAGLWQPRMRTEVFRDGASLGVAAAPTTNLTATTNAVLIGQVDNLLDATRYLKGDIAEIIAFARALDTNTLHRLGASLARKYGLAYAFEVRNPDADDDGLPDDYERATAAGVAGLSGSADSDGDRVSDLAEWLAGTDPQNPASFFAVAEVLPAASGVTLRWSAATGRAYHVESAADPASPYTVLLTNVVAVPPLQAVTVTPAQAGAVLRVRLAP